MAKDTSCPELLLGTDFAYWGGEGPQIPHHLRRHVSGSGTTFDLCCVRGYKANFPEQFVDEAVTWLRSLGAWGRIGRPLDWDLIKDA